MAKIISLFNQNRGVGMTTTAVNLSACLAKMDIKVLGIDLDPQSNINSGLDIDRTNLEYSTYDIIVNDV
ncbi:AAA family ATPase, partial [Anaerofustis stercorihominis]|uniref:ParA family protein n=1 Tax=Anaerofustis stercorihominis TaxID=214853 RepID=UPI00210CBF58